MIYRSDIATLRNNIENEIGKKIILRESPGKRSKTLEKSAVIEKIYPSYFRVKFDNNDSTGAYNYTDVFTKAIEIEVYDGENYSPLGVPAIETKKSREKEILNQMTTSEIMRNS
mgnify:CR=1 FL=1